MKCLTNYVCTINLFSPFPDVQREGTMFFGSEVSLFFALVALVARAALAALVALVALVASVLSLLRCSRCSRRSRAALVALVASRVSTASPPATHVSLGFHALPDVGFRTSTGFQVFGLL